MSQEDLEVVATQEQLLHWVREHRERRLLHALQVRPSHYKSSYEHGELYNLNRPFLEKCMALNVDDFSTFEGYIRPEDLLVGAGQMERAQLIEATQYLMRVGAKPDSFAKDAYHYEYYRVLQVPEAAAELIAGLTQPGKDHAIRFLGRVGAEDVNRVADLLLDAGAVVKPEHLEQLVASATSATARTVIPHLLKRTGIVPSEASLCIVLGQLKILAGHVAYDEVREVFDLLCAAEHRWEEYGQVLLLAVDAGELQLVLSLLDRGVPAGRTKTLIWRYLWYAGSYGTTIVHRQRCIEAVVARMDTLDEASLLTPSLLFGLSREQMEARVFAQTDAREAMWLRSLGFTFSGWPSPPAGGPGFGDVFAWFAWKESAPEQFARHVFTWNLCYKEAGQWYKRTSDDVVALLDRWWSYVPRNDWWNYDWDRRQYEALSDEAKALCAGATAPSNMFGTYMLSASRKDKAMKDVAKQLLVPELSSVSGADAQRLDNWYTFCLPGCVLVPDVPGYVRKGVGLNPLTHELIDMPELSMDSDSEECRERETVCDEGEGLGAGQGHTGGGEGSAFQHELDTAWLRAVNDAARTKSVASIEACAVMLAKMCME